MTTAIAHASLDETLMAIGSFFNVSKLELVVQRRGGFVYKGLLKRQIVYIKLSNDFAPFNREVEVLQVIPRNKIFPELIGCKEINGWYVRILSEISGSSLTNVLSTLQPATERIRLIETCGRLLATFHQTLGTAELVKLQFWRKAEQADCELPAWQGHIQHLVKKWVGRIRYVEADKRIHLEHAINKIADLSAHIAEPATKSILHCDFVDRNIIVHSCNQTVGLIDFEEVQIGDPAYDAAKFVWATLDWQSQTEVLAFYKAWADAYGVQPNWFLFQVYVAIQAIAAIAWCDKNALDATENTHFRANAIRTLTAVTQALPG